MQENITTEGICLYELPVGTQLKIGDTIQEVTDRKNVTMDVKLKTLLETVTMPREGIFTKIIKEGQSPEMI